MSSVRIRMGPSAVRIRVHLSPVPIPKTCGGESDPIASPRRWLPSHQARGLTSTMRAGVSAKLS